MDFLNESGPKWISSETKCHLPAFEKCPEQMARRFKENTTLRSIWRVKRDTALNPSDGKLDVWTSRSQPTPTATEHLPQLELG